MTLRHIVQQFLVSLQSGHWTGHRQVILPADSFHPFCVTGRRVCSQLGLTFWSRYKSCFCGHRRLA